MRISENSKREVACASVQDLDSLMTRLDTEGFDYELAQTGGYMMNIDVLMPDGIPVVISWDGVWLMGLDHGEDPAYDGTEDLADAESLDTVIRILREHAAAF